MIHQLERVGVRFRIILLAGKNEMFSLPIGASKLLGCGRVGYNGHLGLVARGLENVKEHQGTKYCVEQEIVEMPGFRGTRFRHDDRKIPWNHVFVTFADGTKPYSSFCRHIFLPDRIALIHGTR